MVSFDWGGRPFTIERGKQRIKEQFVKYLKTQSGSSFVVDVQNARSSLMESDRRQFDDMIKEIISEIKVEQSLKEMIASQATGKQGIEDFIKPKGVGIKGAGNTRVTNQKNVEFLEGRKLSDIDKPRVLNNLKGTAFMNYRSLDNLEQFDAEDYLDAYPPEIDFELRLESKKMDMSKEPNPDAPEVFNYGNDQFKIEGYDVDNQRDLKSEHIESQIGRKPKYKAAKRKDKTSLPRIMLDLPIEIPDEMVEKLMKSVKVVGYRAKPIKTEGKITDFEITKKRKVFSNRFKLFSDMEDVEKRTDLMIGKGIYQIGSDYYALDSDWNSATFANLKDYDSAYDKVLDDFTELYNDTIQQRVIEPYITNNLKVVDFTVNGDIKVTLKEYKSLAEKFAQSQKRKYFTDKGKRATPLTQEQMNPSEIFSASIIESYPARISIKADKEIKSGNKKNKNEKGVSLKEKKYYTKVMKILDKKDFAKVAKGMKVKFSNGFTVTIRSKSPNTQTVRTVERMIMRHPREQPYDVTLIKTKEADFADLATLENVAYRNKDSGETISTGEYQRLSEEDRLKYVQLWNIITDEQNQITELKLENMPDEYTELVGYKLKDAPEDAVAFIEEGEVVTGKRLVAKKGTQKNADGDEEEISNKAIAAQILSDYRYRPNEATDASQDITPIEYSKLPNANNAQFFINVRAYKKKDVGYGGSKAFELPKKYVRDTTYTNKESGKEISASEFNSMLLDEKNNAQEIIGQYSKNAGETLSPVQYKKRKEADISANREGYKLFREVEDTAIAASGESRKEYFLSTKEYNDLPDSKKELYERAYEGKDQINPKEYKELSEKKAGEEKNYSGGIDTEQRYQQDYRPVDFYQIYRQFAIDNKLPVPPTSKKSFNQKDVEDGLKQYNELNDTNLKFDDIFELKEVKGKEKKFFTQDELEEYLRNPDEEAPTPRMIFVGISDMRGLGQQRFPEDEWEKVTKVKEFESEDAKEKFKRFVLKLKEEQALTFSTGTDVDITSPAKYSRAVAMGTGVVLGEDYLTALHTYYNINAGFANAQVQVTVTVKTVGEFSLPANIRKPNKPMKQAIERIQIAFTRVEDALR